MAFKKTLVQKLFNLSRFSTPRNAPGKPSLRDTNPTRKISDPDQGHCHPGRVSRIHNSAGRVGLGHSDPGRLFPLTGLGLAEALREMDITKGRLTLDGLVANPSRVVNEEEDKAEMTVKEVRKVLRATQVEAIRIKLKNVGKDWISYKEFIGLIEEFCGGNRDQALEFGKMLDECGSVIVLGGSVCLKPSQVAKAIHSLVTPPVSADLNDPRRKELELMEEQKAEIDLKADTLVRRELWAGLGYMVVQTAAFMRLTFWELSWDVMEPICFYVTSAYFMLGYTFFLRTSNEPSFEGFFKSRFNAKQKRLMKAREFDLKRYNELREAFYPNSVSSSPSLDDTRWIKFDYHNKVN